MNLKTIVPVNTEDVLKVCIVPITIYYLEEKKK